MSAAEGVTFSLKAMINKEKTKVLFAEANADFVDVLLSFLTMPLGKVVKVLEKHYGDKAPAIGSLNSLYKGLANLDDFNFWTQGGKQVMLNPRSAFEAECHRLKHDLTDTPIPEYFYCTRCDKLQYGVSMYYDAATCEQKRHGAMNKGRRSPAAGGDGVFTANMVSFIISDDLHFYPDVTELIPIISILGITDADGAELMNVTFGLSEIMDLLKASLVSPTPLSDIILNQKRQPAPAIVKSEPGSFSLYPKATSNSMNMVLNVIVQKSTNKILYARAGEDFIDFLISFLTIPLGRTVSLLGRRTCFVGIDNLYKSIVHLKDCKFLKTLNMKTRLINLASPHGSVSNNQILPLNEESFPAVDHVSFSSVNFPKGKAKYVKGLRTYTVSNDLTVKSLCAPSTISIINDLKIPLSDVKEEKLQIGQPEALRILHAALSSTCVLDDALKINLVSKEKPKQESA